mmetsp:Transcript_44326/g.60128  ORF Transcript_44326/g.60128 Transcript_44326/m.60128 type:complete len:89 (-) Transcript_44326:1233-1499(-)
MPPGANAGASKESSEPCSRRATRELALHRVPHSHVTAPLARAALRGFRLMSDDPVLDDACKAHDVAPRLFILRALGQVLPQPSDRLRD